MLRLCHCAVQGTRGKVHERVIAAAKELGCEDVLCALKVCACKYIDGFEACSPTCMAKSMRLVRIPERPMRDPDEGL